MKYVIAGIVILFTLLCMAAIAVGADYEKSHSKSDKSISKEDKSFSKIDKSSFKDPKKEYGTLYNKTACPCKNACLNYPDCGSNCPTNCPGKHGNFARYPKMQQK